MTIELPAELETALQAQAQARGLTPDRYVMELLERSVPASAQAARRLPLKTGLGMWSKYGINLTDEDIAENRADMFRNFGEEF